MADGGPTKLLVKHLPSQLSVSDKTDLLKHFGAKEVICMERRGKMVSMNGILFRFRQKRNHVQCVVILIDCLTQRVIMFDLTSQFSLRFET